MYNNILHSTSANPNRRPVVIFTEKRSIVMLKIFMWSVARHSGSIGQMVDLGRQEDWSDYMLVEWAAALELHQRGRVKAVLPLLVGETDFWSEAHAAFGGIQALPTQVSSATVEKVVAHLDQTTGDDSLSKLRELLQLAKLWQF